MTGAGDSGAGNDYVSLRKRAATYIRLHALEFAPFLPYEPSDGYPEDDPSNEVKVKAAVDKYCQRLSSTSVWGGHPEIRALASTLGVPIMIYQAEGDAWRMAPDNEGGEGDAMVKTPTGASGKRRSDDDDNEGVLRLSFHRHYYALGEHYNSVVRGGAGGKSR
jgi:OTU domain-containing protein 6